MSNHLEMTLLFCILLFFVKYTNIVYHKGVADTPCFPGAGREGDFRDLRKLLFQCHLNGRGVCFTCT